MRAGQQTLQEDVFLETMVRLILPPSRLSLSPAQELTVEVLRQHGPAPLPFVVDWVARRFYQDEIRNGSGS